MNLGNIRQKMLISLGFGVIVMLAVSLYGDLPKLVTTLGAFQWAYLPLVLVLTLWNYVVRFGKWHYYLGLIGAGPISYRDSFLVFFSGLSMTITPAKVGEWLKSFLLKEITGTPLSASAPIIVAERISDGIAMILLATFGIGALVFQQEGLPNGGRLPPYTQEALIAIFVITVAVIVVVQWRSLAVRILKLGERAPLMSRRIDVLERFYESSYRLLGGRSLLLAIGMGIISWFGECVALYFVLLGLGVEPSWPLLAQATFVLAASSVIASLSGLPGGLGIAEGSIMAIVLALGVTNDQAVAAGATLLIRACTLWFGVLVGIAALFVFTREVKPLTLPEGSS